MTSIAPTHTNSLSPYYHALSTAAQRELNETAAALFNVTSGLRWGHRDCLVYYHRLGLIDDISPRIRLV